ncbi:MAG: hypothetical protein RL367_1720, partial [Pseudomonadota bacterium]
MAKNGRMSRTAISYYTLKRIASLWLLLLAVSCVPVESNFRTIPGKRGFALTVPIPPPVENPLLEQAG